LIAFNTMLWKEAQLDTCVTVIDLHSFADHVALLQGFGDKFTDGLDQSTPEGRQEGERSIADLLIEQVEFANVIVLNKKPIWSRTMNKRTRTIAFRPSIPRPKLWPPNTRNST
jgi:G3E family GTPase